MNESAIKDSLVETLELNPNSMAFAYLADFYIQEGELEKAKDILEKGLENFPDYFTGALIYARLLMQLGDYAAAQNQFETVLRQDPRCLSARQNLVTIYNKLGKSSELESIESVLSSIDPFYSANDAGPEEFISVENSGSNSENAEVSEALDEIFGTEDASDNGGVEIPSDAETIEASGENSEFSAFDLDNHLDDHLGADVDVEVPSDNSDESAESAPASDNPSLEDLIGEDEEEEESDLIVDNASLEDNPFDVESGTESIFGEEDEVLKSVENAEEGAEDASAETLFEEAGTEEDIEQNEEVASGDVESLFDESPTSPEDASENITPDEGVGEAAESLFEEPASSEDEPEVPENTSTDTESLFDESPEIMGVSDSLFETEAGQDTEVSSEAESIFESGVETKEENNLIADTPAEDTPDIDSIFESNAEPDPGEVAVEEASPIEETPREMPLREDEPLNLDLPDSDDELDLSLDADLDMGDELNLGGSSEESDIDLAATAPTVEEALEGLDLASDAIPAAAEAPEVDADIELSEPAMDTDISSTPVDTSVDVSSDTVPEMEAGQLDSEPDLELASSGIESEMVPETDMDLDLGTEFNTTSDVVSALEENETPPIVEESSLNIAEDMMEAPPEPVHSIAEEAPGIHTEPDMDNSTPDEGAPALEESVFESTSELDAQPFTKEENTTETADSFGVEEENETELSGIDDIEVENSPELIEEAGSDALDLNIVSNEENESENVVPGDDIPALDEPALGTSPASTEIPPLIEEKAEEESNNQTLGDNPEISVDLSIEMERDTTPADMGSVDLETHIESGAEAAPDEAEDLDLNVEWSPNTEPESTSSEEDSITEDSIFEMSADSESPVHSNEESLANEDSGLELEIAPEISMDVGLETEGELSDLGNVGLEDTSAIIEETSSEDTHSSNLEIVPDPESDLGILDADEPVIAEDSILESPEEPDVLPFNEESALENKEELGLETTPDFSIDLNFETENEADSGAGLSSDEKDSSTPVFEKEDLSVSSEPLDFNTASETNEEIDLPEKADETEKEELLSEIPEETEVLDVSNEEEALGLSDSLNVETTSGPDLAVEESKAEPEDSLIPETELEAERDEALTLGEVSEQDIGLPEDIALDVQEPAPDHEDDNPPITDEDLVPEASIIPEEASSDSGISGMDLRTEVEESIDAQPEEPSLSNLFSEEPQKIEIPDYPPESENEMASIFDEAKEEGDNLATDDTENEPALEESNADHLIDVPENPFDVRVDFEADLENEEDSLDSGDSAANLYEGKEEPVSPEAKNIEDRESRVTEEAGADHLIDVPEDPFDVRVDLEMDEDEVFEENTSEDLSAEHTISSENDVVNFETETKTDEAEETSAPEESGHLIDVPENPFDVRVDFENDLEEDIFSEVPADDTGESETSELETQEETAFSDKEAHEIESSAVPNSEERESLEVEENVDSQPSALDEMDDSDTEIIENSEDDEKQVPSFEEVIGLKPKNSIFDPENPNLEMPSATVTLAEIYFKQGLFEQSLSMYKNMLEDHPNDEKIFTRIEEIKAAQQAKVEAEEAEAQKKFRPGGKKKKRPN